jgi:hypothetical protein
MFDLIGNLLNAEADRNQKVRRPRGSAVVDSES